MKQEENINIIAIFHNFWRYKWSILLILSCVLILTFFYIKQLAPIYSSHILINIGDYKKSSINSLFPNQYISTDTDKESIANYEIKILKSRYIIADTLEKIDLSKRFFIKNKWHDEELYQDKIPFKISFKNKISTKKTFNFILEEIDKENFTLKIETSDHKIKDIISKCNYSQLIQRKSYEIKINKKEIKKSLNGVKYYIKIETNKENLISEISNNLSINQEVNSLLSINYEDTVPQRAQEILSQLVLTYQRYNLKIRQMKDVNNIAFFNKMIVEVEEKLKKTGNKLKSYKHNHKELLIVGSKDNVFMNNIEKKHQIDLLSLKLLSLKTTRDNIKNEIYTISILENSNLNTTDIQELIKELREKNKYLTLLNQQQNNINTTLITDSAYTRLLTKYHDANKILEELTMEYTELHPEVQTVTREINRLEEKLNSYLQENIEQSKRVIEKLRKEIYKTIQMLINSIAEEYSSLKESVEKNENKIEKLPNATMKLEELTRTFKVHEINYNKLLQKRSEALISKESTMSNIQIIDPPSLSKIPIKPKKNFLYLSGFILGFLLSIIWISYRIRTNKRVENRYDLPLKNHSLIFEEKDIAKELWTLITHFEKSTYEQARVILVSSSDYKEDKTLTVENLSKTLSTISKKVLIIDFDVYHPNLTKKITQSSLGLSTLLTSKHSIEEINLDVYILHTIYNKEYGEIDLLPSGPILPNGASLLFNEKVPSLFEKLSYQYDYILIDTPPFRNYPEISILLNYVNIFLVVVKKGKTDKNSLENFQHTQKNKENNTIDKIILLN